MMCRTEIFPDCLLIRTLAQNLARISAFYPETEARFPRAVETTDVASRVEQLLVPSFRHPGKSSRTRCSGRPCAPTHHLVTELPVTIKSQVPLDHDGSPAFSSARVVARLRRPSRSLFCLGNHLDFPLSTRRLVDGVDPLGPPSGIASRSVALLSLSPFLYARNQILSPIQTVRRSSTLQRRALAT